MKRIILIIIMILFICGCTNNKEKEQIKENNVKEKVEEKEKVKEKEVIDTYKDENTTPIGIYKLEGNTLTRLSTINETPVVEKDIGIFQIYPSNEENIYLNKGFGLACYDEWTKYNNIKLGFNIKFSLSSGENISYNIFSPENTFDKWEYLMNYLYDDYTNFGKGFYSHIEKEEFNDNTLVTAIKLQNSYSIDQVNSKIILTVFTYDTEDDFQDNEYRGNSYHSINICLEGRDC